MSSITSAHVGLKASFKGGEGIIRYVGETDFQDGVWVGLELETPTGEHLYFVRREFDLTPTNLEVPKQKKQNWLKIISRNMHIPTLRNKRWICVGQTLF